MVRFHILLKLYLRLYQLYKLLKLVSNTEIKNIMLINALGNETNSKYI